MVALLKSNLIAAALILSTAVYGHTDTLLLDFTSASCGPCPEMRPVIERLVRAGYRVRQVDIAREPEIAKQFKVDQVPTLVSLVDGREYARMVGKGSYEELVQMMTPHAVRGQSPEAPQSRSLAQLASVNRNAAPVPTYSGLETPQEGRIIEIEDPNRVPARPVSSANPFGNSAATTNPVASGKPGWGRPSSRGERA